jgi:myo-inositol-1(or 4)-monophosphatase
MHPNLHADLELALRAARSAGAAVMRAFRREQEVRYKGPDQPVTDADLRADRLLRELLQGERPEYGWLSEETADSPERLDRGRVWVVDPIDGTRSFVEGEPEFSISVGLAEEGRAVLGVVYNPASGELYHALSGGGAFRNGAPVPAAPAADAARRLLLASRTELGRGELDAFRQEWSFRPMGSTAYKMVKVADGTGDLFVSRGPKGEWDVCGAEVVVREAGGRVTDTRGEELIYNRPHPRVRGVIVSRGAHHEEARARVAEGEGGHAS